MAFSERNCLSVIFIFVLVVVVCLVIGDWYIIRMKNISPKIAFALVSFFLGELGDGLNIFQVRIRVMQMHMMCTKL